MSSYEIVEKIDIVYPIPLSNDAETEMDIGVISDLEVIIVAKDENITYARDKEGSMYKVNNNTGKVLKNGITLTHKSLIYHRMETRSIDEYTEILNLKMMLEKAEIPFEFFHYTETNSHQICYPTQICYPMSDNKYRVCSAIEGRYTYGGEENLIEIMGLCTDKNDTVEGYLTAKEVFKKISEHYNSNKETVNMQIKSIKQELERL